MTKRIFAFLVSLVLFSMVAIPVFADEEVVEIDDAPVLYDAFEETEDIAIAPIHYVADLADVLTDEEEQLLENKLVNVYNTYGYDLVVLTTKGVDPDDRMATADDYYDYNGYCGNGALLLSNFQEDGSYYSGNSWISTAGSCIRNISDDDIQNIGSYVTFYLDAGEYYSAFDVYIDETVDTIEGNKTSANGQKYLVIFASVIACGLIGAFVYTSKLKRQLISVEEATDANNYLVDGSLNITQSRDTFLYANVVKTARAKESSGSSTHTSSSGSSHGGGGF